MGEEVAVNSSTASHFTRPLVADLCVDSVEGSVIEARKGSAELSERVESGALECGGDDLVSEHLVAHRHVEGFAHKAGDLQRRGVVVGQKEP